MKNTNLIIAAFVLIILAGVGGFFGGIQFQKSQNTTPQFGNGPQGTRTNGNGQFQQGTGSNRNGLRPVSGEIISSDDKSVTVKLTDGSSKIVLFTDKTAISKSTQASKSDLKVGEKIATFGTENSDGSVTAENIQLNPTMNGFGGPKVSPSAQ